ncbi:unnamed protein product [Plutella xylostella]|uniref:Trimethyllysine dioxygenase, mitochondrial n=1 Tax=Plutella xylostella TaxID=51655 RepID=A0A8S4G4R5_PLUXY|nr:unnamed protein product [Plutella xylostella]
MDKLAETPPVISSAELVDQAVAVVFEDGRSLSFEDCWLRDQCRCTTCYNHTTFQRATHILDIPDSKVAKIVFDPSQLCLTWNDGHESSYAAEFLSEFDYSTWKEKSRLRPVLWRGADVAGRVARVPVDEFLNSVDAQKRVFQSLLDYGVVLFEGVEPTLDATEAICNGLGGVQHTLFGGMWRFSSGQQRADTAYTSLPLAAHTDNTYCTEAAGLQIFHCLQHSGGTGGETVLSDGFFAASQLKADHPEDFTFLSSFHLQAEYVEPGHHHAYSAPVISVDERTGDLKQIRYNVYDRSTMAFSSAEECRSYYRSLRSFARYCEDPKNQWIFKLTPGLVLAFDNFRVLHGRTAFTGERVLGGSYVARSDWLDRARTLKLIE